MPQKQMNDDDTVSHDRVVPQDRIDGLRAFVDVAIATDDRKLAIIGWIFDPREQVSGISLLQATSDIEGAPKDDSGSSTYHKLPIEHDVDGMQLVRVARPDVSMAMSGIVRSTSDMHGFIIVVPFAPDNPVLSLETASGHHVIVPLTWLTSTGDAVKALKLLTGVPQTMILSTLRAGIGDTHPLYSLIRDLPSDLPSGVIAPTKAGVISRRKSSAKRLGTTLADFSQLPLSVEKPDMVIGCVDRGYPLGDAGILFFGWYFCPKDQPLSISVCDDAGNATPVEQHLVKLARLDVVNAYASRFPSVDGMCGYAILAPVPTKGSEPRALFFDFGEAGEAWLKIPSERPSSSGVSLAKDILGIINDPAQVRSKLYDIFDKVIGKAVEAVSSARRLSKDEVDILQYGTPPAAPDVSLIVPLYGRFDFVRHQLAHFADDPEMRNADLIYVIDDPAIVAQTLDLASKYHQLFSVPFRMVWYGDNRGYASANNVGARFARGRHIVLLNSDVIPQQPGWLSTLSKALEALPDAGAVGPLLQFGDGSIQHAGMYPRTDVSWPGFILNTHKNMGMAWTQPDTPSEHPMLTAACIMMRTADFRGVGGFDENYLIGDFEDSDLCLCLRKKGLRLYLVPAAKLWHLERQSQNLDSIAGYRQRLTLFNGWRYARKIRNGELVNPLTLELKS